MESSGRIIGYLILIMEVIETITGDRQAYIYDYGVSSEFAPETVLPLLLERSAEISLNKGMRYLTLEIYAHDTGRENLFAGIGFKKEIHRITKRVTRNAIPQVTPDPYRVRQASADDIFFIIWLNSQSASFTIPPERDAPRDEILLRYMSSYVSLPIGSDEHFSALIIEDRNIFKPIGYLLLKMRYRDAVTGDLLAYIYDIAIHPDYWGKRAVHRLMKEAENMLAERGISYWMGDISAGNPRALKTALKSLRFLLESSRWLKKLPKC